MGLEVPTYLNDLNPAWPVGGLDPRSQGDDHLRALKQTLQNTFPFFNGRIWRRRNVSASGALVRSDNTSLIRATSAVTLTPEAASVLGNWMVVVRADGGDVIINPAAPINGGDTFTVPNGYNAFVFSDGNEFFSFLAFSAVPAAVKAFPTGTVIPFHQTAAPVGWTKLTGGVYDNAAMRLTTGTAGSGGGTAFTTAFNAGKSTSGHTLSTAQMPSHNHWFGNNFWVQAGSGRGDVSPGSADQAAQGPASAGGSGSHSHSIPSLDVKFIDFILAQMN